ncbi:MAG: pyridoxal 5'-phosphate synthase glutaminase subunit PdxT [Treponemataceae bacterium]
MDRRLTIGVLSLQGGVVEHITALRRLDAAERETGGLGIEARSVKTRADLVGLDGIILPGGESSAVGKMLGDHGMLVPLRDAITAGLPAWGTCMGAILLAKELENDDRRHLGLMDINVRRNAYGGQLDSFIERAEIPAISGGFGHGLASGTASGTPFPMMFIRAPIIAEVGAGVTVLARVRGEIVACRQNHLLATTFHPELTEDLRFHAYFAGMIRERVETPETPRKV